jgi:AraC-like DNA-binding protein
MEEGPRAEHQDLADRLRELHVRLWYIENSHRPRIPDAIELKLIGDGPTRLEMAADRNHRRPHFHISYKNEFSASYALDTFEVLVGLVPPRYSRVILDWAKSNQPRLLSAWQDLQAGRSPRKLTLSS